MARAIANAFAEASDRAIPIDNTKGSLDTEKEDNTIEATATASEKAIAINNIQGVINTLILHGYLAGLKPKIPCARQQSLQIERIAYNFHYVENSPP